MTSDQKGQRQKLYKERRRYIRLITTLMLLAVFLVTSVSALYIQYALDEMKTYYIKELAATEIGYIEDIKYIGESFNKIIDEKDQIIYQNEAYIRELEGEIESMICTRAENNEREFALYHRFWYVIKNAQISDGITMDLIEYADAMSQEFNVNPHLVWNIIELESDYDIDIYNTTTDAGGLGQFMESTGRYVYETLLGHGPGTYDHHTTAKDPYANVSMTAAYLRYLLDRYNGDLRTSLREYSGGSTTYYDVIVSRMRSVGYDISVTTYIDK